MTNINDLFISTHFKVSDKQETNSKYKVEVSVLYQDEKEVFYVDSVNTLLDLLYYLNLWKKEDTIIKSIRVTDLEINILILVI